MKKSYFKMKMKLIAIELIVLILGCVVLTYQKATDVQREYIQEVNKSMYFHFELHKNNDGDVEKLIKNVYGAYYRISRDSDVGFYSMLKDSEGNTIAEDQNFIFFVKDNVDDEGTVTQDARIALLGEDYVTKVESAQIEFANCSFKKLEVVGTCDDTFVYIDELNWTDDEGVEYSYVPDKKINATNKETVKFEDWSGSRYFIDNIWDKYDYFVFVNRTCYLYSDCEKGYKLNNEAENICKQIYYDGNNREYMPDYQESIGLFTTYIGNRGPVGEGYSLPYVFVFHPVSIAMEALSQTYILVGIFAVIVIIVTWSLVEDMYKKQLAYENNRRELTRGIAHELKTPLAIAKGYVENWDYLDDDEREQSSKIMIDEIEHMDKMVTDLLELSHFEAKTKAVSLERVDICSLTKSVLGRMKPIIEEKKLTVSGNIYSEEIEGKEYLVEADLEMMRIVLVNFISNAVKYADKEIDISLSDNGKKVGFKITNDGQTIEADNLCKVWDEFYRDATVDQKRIGGNGLGLAITKNILMLHRAKYGCKSEYGKTTFWFEMKYK